MRLATEDLIMGAAASGYLGAAAAELLLLPPPIISRKDPLLASAFIFYS